MNKIIKTNFYYLFVIILFLLSIVFAVLTFHFIGNSNSNDQTYVGTIPISNYDKNQYANTIATNVQTWSDKSSYTITYQNYKFNVDLSLFELDINKTIENIKENQHNFIYFNISDNNKIILQNNLISIFTLNIINKINIDDIVATLISDAKTMNILKNYKLENFYEPGVENTVLSVATINNIDPNDVNNIVDSISSIKIEPNQSFYLLESLSNLNLTNNQLSIIASGIQNISLNSHFTSFIFEQNDSLPTWASTGANVRILNANNYDFSFYNDFDYSMNISLVKTTDNSITFSLIGYPYVNNYSTNQVEINVIPYDTIYEENLTIDATTPNVIITDSSTETTYQLLVQPGINGKIIKFERTITYSDSSTKTIILYYEEYLPINEVYQENTILKGSE